jgi:hypothetical protein
MSDVKYREIKKRIQLLEEECMRLAKAGSFYEPAELIAHAAVNAYEQDMIDRMMSTVVTEQNQINNVIELKPKE